MRPRVRRCAALALVAASALSATPARAHHQVDIGVRCTDFSTQADAQGYLREHPYDPEGLDGPPGPSNDPSGTAGVACEDVPCPCDRTPVGFNAAAEAQFPESRLRPPATTATSAPPGATSPTSPTSVASTTSSTGRRDETASRPIDDTPSRSLRSRVKDFPWQLTLAGLFVVAYALLIRRDRRRLRYPTSHPRYPTQWY